MSKKRSRPSEVDESRAECPFTVKQRAPVARRLEKKTKRDGAEDTHKDEWHSQSCPFIAKAFDDNNESLDIEYSIDPPRWTEMTKYNSFVLGKDKFHTDDYVFVANEESLKRQRTGDASGGIAARKKNGDWVARILEIRALDEQHVYARVFWMYWPDELPAGTSVGRKTIRGGRQSYHGEHELIASNHMDVINAISVTMAAQVNQWVETDDDDSQPSLYWRQAFNCSTKRLSPAREVCKCETPAHPDKVLVRCSNPECSKWMHEDCLRHDVLMRVYGRLGKTQPQKIDADAVMTTIEAAGAAFGDLKPINGGGIKEEEDVDTKKKASVDGTSMLMTPLTPRTELTPSQPLAENGNGTNGVLSPAQKAELPLLLGTGKVLEPGSSPFRKAVFSSGNNKKAKPYKGLYEAHMRLDDGPTAWVIRDLRNNVVGGHKMWLEKVSCLLCSYEID